MENNKKKSISRALLFGTATLVLVICLLMGVFGFTAYVRTVLNKDQAYLRDVLQLTMKQIDPDDLEKCIENKTKSEKFELTQKFLDQVKDYYEDVEYIYIIKPLNTANVDNIMDVMAGITEREVKKAYQAASYILENAALLPISGRQVLKGILSAIWQEELQNAVTTLLNAAGVTAHAGDKCDDPVEYCLRLAERTSPDEK